MYVATGEVVVSDDITTSEFIVYQRPDLTRATEANLEKQNSALHRGYNEPYKFQTPEQVLADNPKQEASAAKKMQ